MNHLSKVSLGCVAFILALQCATADAATLTWTGAGGGGLWNTPTNWSPNGIPGAADTAIVNSGVGNPSITTNVTVAAATIANGYSVNVASGISFTSTAVDLNTGSLTGSAGIFVLAT